MSEAIAQEIRARQRAKAAAAAERDRKGKEILAAFHRANAINEKLRSYRFQDANSDDSADTWRRFRVSIPMSKDIPQRIILAGSEAQAIAPFFKCNGITATDHAVQVNEEPHDGEHAALIVELVRLGHDYAALMPNDGPEQVARRIEQAAEQAANGEDGDVALCGLLIYRAAAAGNAGEVARLIGDVLSDSLDFWLDLHRWLSWRFGCLVLNIRDTETGQTESPKTTAEKPAHDHPLPAPPGDAHGSDGFDAVVAAATSLRSFVETHSGQPDGLEVGRRVESDLKRLDTELYLACSRVDLRFPDFDARRGEHTEFFGFSRLPLVHVFWSGPSESSPPTADFNEVMRRFSKQVEQTAKDARDNRYPWLCPTPGWYQAIDQLIALAQNRIGERQPAATPPVTPPANYGNAQGPAESPIIEQSSGSALDNLKPSHAAAHQQFRRAETALAADPNRDEKRVELREAYDWLADEMNRDGTRSDLPSFDSWARYVRAARKALGTQVNRPRKGRAAGKSIISSRGR